MAIGDGKIVINKIPSYLVRGNWLKEVKESYFLAHIEKQIWCYPCTFEVVRGGALTFEWFPDPEMYIIGVYPKDTHFSQSNCSSIHRLTISAMDRPDQTFCESQVSEVIIV